jgi:hypothetical protein
MSLVRSLGLSLGLLVCVALSTSGCRVYDIYRPDLQRVAQGDRFVETHGTIDPMPTVITLRDKETIALYDENGNEIRTTTVGAVKPKDVEKARYGQVWRYNENRLGWVVGSVLAIGAVVAATFIGIKYK